MRLADDALTTGRHDIVDLPYFAFEAPKLAGNSKPFALMLPVIEIGFIWTFKFKQISPRP
jgi:hypothetical protein